MTTPRDCQHKRSHHTHGTWQAYTRDACRCPPCREAHRIKNLHARKLKAYGRQGEPKVNPGPAREHLQKIHAAGIGSLRMSEYTGLGHTTIGEILTGKTKTIHPRTERTILAMPLDPDMYRSHRQRNTITGSQRRIHALMRLGYSLPALARHTGLHQQTLASISAGGRPHASTTTIEAIRAAYDHLWDKPVRISQSMPENVSRARTIALAKRKGWAPPMAWDDDTIDDPDAEPQGIPTKSRYGHAEADIIEDVQDLLAAGMVAAVIGERLGRKPASIERTLDRAGRHDLAAWLRTGVRSTSLTTRKSAPESRADAA